MSFPLSMRSKRGIVHFYDELRGVTVVLNKEGREKHIYNRLVIIIFSYNRFTSTVLFTEKKYFLKYQNHAYL